MISPHSLNCKHFSRDNVEVDSSEHRINTLVFRIVGTNEISWASRLGINLTISWQGKIRKNSKDLKTLFNLKFSKESNEINYELCISRANVRKNVSCTISEEMNRICDTFVANEYK